MKECENLSIFDIIPGGDEYKAKKSTDWKWSFADYPKEKNGLKVFSCFACGGGSTMGYKLAGCEVLGCCEIDPKMNEVYIKNHNPKHNFLMDIRDFNKLPNEEIPEELFNLDILDGSPPCTTFSMAGEREESWGKKKKFREGQAEQTLDDLSFVFIETVNKLKPKVMIMENVEGLIKGEAWSYVQRIYKQLNDIGYTVKHWLLKGEYMGVPQTRHRVFFIAVRNDIVFDLQSLDMSFNYEPILFQDICCEKGTPINKQSKVYKLMDKIKKGETDLGEAYKRDFGRRGCFNENIVYKEKVTPTIRAASPSYYRFEEKTRITSKEIIKASTFPLDYQFDIDSVNRVCYICGMSVPPIMIKRIVTRLIESGLFDTKERKTK